jgi:hypothetical protein
VVIHTLVYAHVAHAIYPGHQNSSNYMLAFSMKLSIQMAVRLLASSRYTLGVSAQLPGTLCIYTILIHESMQPFGYGPMKKRVNHHRILRGAVNDDDT